MSETRTECWRIGLSWFERLFQTLQVIISLRRGMIAARAAGMVLEWLFRTRIGCTNGYRNALFIGVFDQIIIVLVIRNHQAGGRFGGGEPPNAVFHDLAGLECHHIFRIHFDGLIRPWVPRSARFAQFNLKHPEVPQLDSPLGDEGVDNRVERQLDDFFCFELRQMRLLGDLFNNFFLRHRSRPPDGGIMPKPFAGALFKSKFCKGYSQDASPVPVAFPP